MLPKLHNGGVKPAAAAIDPGALPPWLSVTAGGVRLRIHVQPGARRSAVVGAHGDRLKVALQAPPVDGKANAALVKLLAQRLNTAQRDIVLVNGQNSRDKTVDVGCSVPMALQLAGGA